MIETDKYGVYHVTNEGYCIWYEFAKEIFRISDVDININPILTFEYPIKALRQMNSKMSKSKLEQNGFNKLRKWKNAVRDCLIIN